VRLVDRLVEPEAFGDLLVRRIPQHGRSADQDRHVVHAHVELIEQLLRVRLPVEIRVAIRMAVPGEKFHYA